MAGHLERYLVAHRQQVVDLAGNWWGKYAVSMRDTERQHDDATKFLARLIAEVGYDC
jgi:hypothetical protein